MAEHDILHPGPQQQRHQTTPNKFRQQGPHRPLRKIRNGPPITTKPQQNPPKRNNRHLLIVTEETPIQIKRSRNKIDTEIYQLGRNWDEKVAED